MKRHNNIYQHIISIENLKQADVNARKGKTSQSCIKRHDLNKDNNLLNLHYQLKNKTYKTSPYTTFKITDPKPRVIYRLPYFPDRILQHAIMIWIEKVLTRTFTADTYNCIKGRGIHPASNKIKQAIKDEENTKYCLKIDITQFYPSIDHDILKSLLRRKIKDQDLLWLLDEIIDSAPGLPIGNYLSQFLANFYLTYFDHYIKESQRVFKYFRYADDMAFFSKSKQFLHNLLANIKRYLWDNLKLTVKNNYQIFAVKIRGVDMLGYIHFPKYTLIRKKTKKAFARMLKYRPNQHSTNSYLGLLKHADCINLTNKLCYAS